MSLDVSQGLIFELSFASLVAVCAANAHTLRELRLGTSFDPTQLGDLLRAAPSLQLLETEVLFYNEPEACQVLRREGHFAPVQLRAMYQVGVWDDDERLFEFMAACGAQASLRCIRLSGGLSGSRAALEAVVDASISAQVEDLCLDGRWPRNSSGVNAASVPALTRLLSTSTWLTRLGVRNKNAEPMTDAPAAQALVAALRSNRTLRCLELTGIMLWRDMGVAEALLGALVGHPSLEKLSLVDEEIPAGEDADAAGVMLAALIAANAPALRTLSIIEIPLGDACLRPLVDALPGNTHLTTLLIDECGMSDGFARVQLLAAVRANASLRDLYTGLDAAAAAEDFVDARTAAAQ